MRAKMMIFTSCLFFMVCGSFLKASNEKNEPGYRACNTSVVYKRLFLYDDIHAFPWSGFMGSPSAGGGKTINFDCVENPRGGVYCVKVVITGENDWDGIWMQNSASNWDGPGVDFSGCVRCEFSVRGTANENIQIVMFDDQVSRTVTLNESWHDMTIEGLSEYDLSSVNNIFGFTIDASREVQIYFDEIKLVFPRSGDIPSAVSIQGNLANRNFQLLVDDEEWFVRGFGYNSVDESCYERDFQLVKNACGNTIRTWGQGDISFSALDEMHGAGLKVLAGYWILTGSEWPDSPPRDYTDSVYRQAVEYSLTNFIECYKDHPAILGWIAGNEVFEFLQPDTQENKTAFAEFLNEQCMNIHAVDPNHPAGYAAAGLNPVESIIQHAPSLDIYCCNSYEGAEQVIADYPGWDYDRPLLFTEYGCDGWWATEWSQYDDCERAQDYAIRWTEGISAAKGLTIGGCAFAWLNKMDPGAPEEGWGIMSKDRNKKLQYYAVEQAYCNMRPGTDIYLTGLEMPMSPFTPGSECYLSALFCNGCESLNDVYLYVILEVYGEFFFWPGWETAIDFEEIAVIENGYGIVQIINPFQWPETEESLYNLFFYSAVLDQNDRLIGNIADWIFSYHSN